MPTILFFVIACGQTYNSNTFDANFANTSYCTNTSNTNLCAANEIIFTKCVDCHDHTHDSWRNFLTDSLWTASGRVVPGNAAGSTLIQKLWSEGGNMPKDKPPLTEAEVNTLRTWINSM